MKKLFLIIVVLAVAAVGYYVMTSYRSNQDVINSESTEMNGETTNMDESAQPDPTLDEEPDMSAPEEQAPVMEEPKASDVQEQAPAVEEQAPVMEEQVPATEEAPAAAEPQDQSQNQSNDHEMRQDQAQLNEEGNLFVDFTHEYGNPQAKVTIHEVSSLTCPHCADFYLKGWEQFKTDFLDKDLVYMIKHDFVGDRHALHGLMIAHCLPKRHFENFQNLLFQNQAKWLLSHNPDEKLYSYSQLVGMSKAEFDACLENKQLQKRIIDYSQSLRTRFKIVATPSFVFDDDSYRIEGFRNYENFKETLTQGLKGVKP